MFRITLALIGDNAVILRKRNEVLSAALEERKKYGSTMKRKVFDCQSHCGFRMESKMGRFILGTVC